MLIAKLQSAEDRYREIEQMLTLPDVISNTKLYAGLLREYNGLTDVVTKYREYVSCERR